MVNIWEIYDIWERDFVDDLSFRNDLNIIELFSNKYGFTNNYELVHQFLKENNILSISISNIISEITSKDLLIDITDDQPYSLDIPTISDSVCAIIHVLKSFQVNKKYNCVLDISNYIISKIMDFCIKYNIFSKYYFNIKVVYNLFKGFILVIEDYFTNFNKDLKLKTIESLSRYIVMLNDKMSLYKDNTAFVDLRTLLINIRDKLYDEIKL